MGSSLSAPAAPVGTVASGPSLNEEIAVGGRNKRRGHGRTRGHGKSQRKGRGRTQRRGRGRGRGQRGGVINVYT